MLVQTVPPAIPVAPVEVEPALRAVPTCSVAIPERLGHAPLQ